MRKRAFTYILLLFLVAPGISLVSAQETKDSQAQTNTQSAQKTQVSAYHVDFSIDELQNGKKVNSRQYSMILTDEREVKELKIGTRVPVESEAGKFQYLDVGTTINVQMVSWEAPLGLDVMVDVSNIANPDSISGNGHPLLRRMEISGRAPVILGKPMVFGSVDDPNSNHEFQLVVTVTKL